jgi:ubiquinone/menaquinone biosynthesis C-methylase UbiE
MMTETERIAAVYASYEQNANRQKRYAYGDSAQFYRLQQVARDIHRLLRQWNGEGKSVLEIGCGSGYWLRECLKWGVEPSRLTGLDIRPDALAKARMLCPATVTLDCWDAAHLPYASSSLDMVLQMTVFSSVLDGTMREQMAGEIMRVLKPGGCVLWYDLAVSNPWNPNVIGLRKQQIRHLFPDCRIRFKRVTLAPPLARYIVPYSIGLCAGLERLRILNAHYLCLIHKP